MATSVPADPEVALFIREMEKDYRINIVSVYKHHPSTPETYLINLRLPANYEVTFTAHKLTEAKRYMTDNIEAWYKTARTPTTLTTNRST